MANRPAVGRFRDFLDGYQGLVSTTGALDLLDYTALSIDSRTVKAGQLFVAIKGEFHDAHRFLPDVAGKRPSAVVAEAAWMQREGSSLPEKCPLVVVQDTLDFLQQLGAWHRRRFDIPLIGITGSNGKTTTREMLAEVLQQKYRIFRSSGNKNNHIGLPLMLLQLADDAEIAVLELGSNHPGEIGHLARLAGPTAALITNIGKGHIGYFGSLEAVYSEKTALFEELPNGSAVFLNVADDYLREYRNPDRRIITVGNRDGVDVKVRFAGVDRLGCCKLRINDRLDIQLRVPGNHQVANAALAIAVGLHFGVGDEQIKQALENFSPADQRMQMYQREGVLVINDAYNANPDSVRAAIDYLSGLKDSRRRFLVIGDMLEMGEFVEEEHRGVGEQICHRNIDAVYCYGPAAKYIHQAIREGNGSMESGWFETHEEIAVRLRQQLQAGDALLVKGSRGVAMEKVLGHLGY